VDITPLTYEILLALADEDRHGYGIIKEIEGRGAAVPSTGAMYLALQRMQEEGLVKDVPAPPDNEDRRRRYYAITEHGRRVARRESARLARLLEAAKGKKLLGEDAA